MKISFKKILLLAIMLFLLQYPFQTKAQELGVSFSYFIPKDGYFSAPISPFSLRGLGIDLGKYFAVETGFTLYRMSGLNVKGLPFDSNKPLVGPNFTILTPLEGVIQFIGEDQEFRIKAGGFLFFGIDNKLNEGNIDRALRDYQGWDVLNSNLDFDNKVGTGYHFGVEYVFYFANKFGISLGGNYFIGGADLNLKGDVVGGTIAGGFQTSSVDFPGSKIDFTGFEIAIGVIFNTQ